MSYDNANDAGSRKRLRRSKESTESLEIQESAPTNTIDDRLFDVYFPKHIEPRFAAAIFELGLKHSSPKILMPLMPEDTNLSTEHIKSHLQKYRIHRQRSKEEFLVFFNEYIKDHFQEWENNKGWTSSQDQLTRHTVDVDAHIIANNRNNGNMDGDYAYGGVNGGNLVNLDTSGAFQYKDNTGLSPSSYGQAESKGDQQANSQFVKEVLQETETMLHSIHGLCQEVIENGDVLKRKPEIQRCSANSN